ncbi:hypothetical protein C5167_044392 [Papaver somniferum]|uniref:Uncharacterized protein n=1 Tax=Papaver somniferum TaxID=3469 RepID=A0A4Y7L8I4_PAPSO|nr:hypothetical protein C5167_044392 [Papaver somniferum]
MVHKIWILSMSSLRGGTGVGKQIVVLQGDGPLYGDAVDLFAQSFLVAVSGNMMSPICNNSCLLCRLSHVHNLAGFCYRGLSS